MRVLLFAGLAEAVGSRELLLPGTLPAATAGELESALRQRYPALARALFRVAVNREYAAAGRTLLDGDEIALIPPVSGG